MADGLNWLSYLVTGMAVVGAIGYGFDRWFGTWPVLFLIGTVVGYSVAVYGMYLHVKAAPAGRPQTTQDDGGSAEG
ncbi:MAG: AtpZ/AtpI family protein [Acidobacteria bacterium]|nr:AtpZ/AtpI family protein [Acidobacteriota bacterium]